ncbi:hypothetical protein PDIG_82880 [Penicillium digitatum PHI26]|uniref:Uncharacterized protein n=2 Tax=Penicillium digitatum TaxID=36651 RepID=K9F8T2_PEND2|nr:hypothetical protein PDIP_86670 [Penicillium digitatum Pd1]EKV04579.1 hypothetical protein PDIP_86670 [Penicillium digitatum Pd1]EKV05544.1 hypothetical protein PDIG_82880 [Penicillium digitatum PHI26]
MGVDIGPSCSIKKKLRVCMKKKETKHPPISISK